MSQQESVKVLVDHLFRKEYGRLVSFLTYKLGLDLMSYAEDIAQETLMEAYKSWGDHGIPENPSAWLFKVARNKSYNLIRREKKRQEITREIDSPPPVEETDVLLEKEIEDSVLRMFFACCSPRISFENQILLILNTLAGFSRKEIASALLLEEETVKKRLFRIKKELRDRKVGLSVPSGKTLETRLNAISNTLYLLFNEGYSSSHRDELIRKDICLEAMRLSQIIVKHFPRAYDARALLALMCFHAARFDSRIDDNGAIVLFQEQDRSSWNKELIDQGIYHLSEASVDESELSSYHLEANIAAEHCTARSFDETNWQRIHRLYSWLYQYKPSPVIQLNIAVVESQLTGAESAIEKLEFLEKKEKRLKKYYLLYATKGQLYSEVGDKERALANFEKAKELTTSSREIHLLDDKIAQLKAD